MNSIVNISEAGAARCKRYACAMVDEYHNGQSERSRSCQVPGREIDQNINMQTFGRMAEAAFCKWLDVNPNTMLDWTVGADNGADVVIPPFRIDVKSSPLVHAQYLIWPVSKIEFYAETSSNILALVRASQSQNSFEIVGWVTKEWFADHHETASAHDALKLDAGTWFMRAGNLWCPEILKATIKEASLQMVIEGVT